jgi:alpha-mannosidase
MQKHLAITLKRIEKFSGDDGIRGRLYVDRRPLEALSVFSTTERIPYAEAVAGDFRPAQIGDVFLPIFSTHWFRVELEIPVEWAGREIHFRWDSSSEACVWIEGEPIQGLTGKEDAWARPIRPSFRLTHSARGGESISFYVEMACNNLFGVKSIEDTFTLKMAEIAVFDRDAWDLLWDFVVVADMAKHLPQDAPRAGQALFAANQMVNVCNLEDRSTWPGARAIAAEFLKARNGDGQHNLSAIGHAHMDTAWLWPLDETKRKCVRSFSSALRLMDEYPDYKFACSQAQQYAWMKESAPNLYAKIKAKARAGKWIPVGGTWVEPDCNLPSGESLVRQFLYGQRFFRAEFGEVCREFWNPDVFGYSAALPQIMRGAGIKYFLTQKLSWNQFNKPASHTFLWEGLDGSQVLTHFPPADTYNALADVETLLYNVKNFKDHERANESFMLFGYGDGGGGPTPEMLEQLQRLKDVDGLPRVEQRSAAEFFARCEADLKDPLTWVGELYFELHRGTYTSQAANKRDNRRSELILHDAEFLSALAHALGRGSYPAAGIERLWKMTLTNQFHDILPGSSIILVYWDSARDYAEILSKTAELRDKAIVDLFGGNGENILAINTLGCERAELVELPLEIESAQQSANGKSLAVISAPALGYSISSLKSLASRTSQVQLSEADDRVVMENEFVVVEFLREGKMIRLYDKRAKRETLSDRGNKFVIYDDNPNDWDAWDVDVFHLEKPLAVLSAHVCHAIESGPLRASVEFEYRISDQSTLKQIVSLDCISPRVDFTTEVNWHEAHKFLKVEFPVNVRAEYATYEIQFGHVQRPTHFNTSWDLARFEVCAHKWADLSEPGFGVALLNDSKYGHAVHRNVMRLSLLRAPKLPDFDADMGGHHFRYALIPHAGSFREAGVIEAAYRFNDPLVVRGTDRAPETKSFFSVDRAGVIVDTIKKAEDSDALIVRLYEAHGGRGPIRFTSALPVESIQRCNLLEEDDHPLEWAGGAATIDIRPFEIVTLKIKFFA